jgi:hypothetical protein
MSAPSSTSRRRTFWPAGPVWCVFELHAEDLAGVLCDLVEPTSPP